MKVCLACCGKGLPKHRLNVTLMYVEILYNKIRQRHKRICICIEGCNLPSISYFNLLYWNLKILGMYSILIQYLQPIPLLDDFSHTLLLYLGLIYFIYIRMLYKDLSYLYSQASILYKYSRISIWWNHSISFLFYSYAVRELFFSIISILDFMDRGLVLIYK